MTAAAAAVQHCVRTSKKAEIEAHKHIQAVQCTVYIDRKEQNNGII